MIKLKELRKKNGLTLRKLGEKLNFAESTLSQYENGKREPDLTTIIKLANFFNVTVDYLIGNENSINNIESVSFNRDTKKIPVYGTIPAGIPIEMIEDTFIDDFVEIDEGLSKKGTYFGLKIKGNSMETEFHDGDILILKQQETCESGDFCAVSINHTECTFKKFLIKENGITLQPLNPEFEPMFFTKEEVEELPISILGVVKEVRRSL